MRYLLDTNICIALLNETSPALEARARRHPATEMALPAVAAFELYYGAFKGRLSNRNLELVDRIALEILPFDADDARMAGAIRSELEAAGEPIGPYDLLIAGQARARGLALVTANTREFARVEGLLLEDWSTPSVEG